MTFHCLLLPLLPIFGHCSWLCCRLSIFRSTHHFGFILLIPCYYILLLFLLLSPLSSSHAIFSSLFCYPSYFSNIFHLDFNALYSFTTFFFQDFLTRTCILKVTLWVSSYLWIFKLLLHNTLNSSSTTWPRSFLDTLCSSPRLLAHNFLLPVNTLHLWLTCGLLTFSSQIKCHILFWGPYPDP